MHYFEVHSNESACRKMDVLVWNKSIITKSFTTVYDYCCGINPYIVSKDRYSVSHALNGDGNVTEQINM